MLNYLSYCEWWPTLMYTAIMANSTTKGSTGKFFKLFSSGKRQRTAALEVLGRLMHRRQMWLPAYPRNSTVIGEEWEGRPTPLYTMKIPNPIMENCIRILTFNYSGHRSKKKIGLRYYLCLTKIHVCDTLHFNWSNISVKSSSFHCQIEMAT